MIRNAVRSKRASGHKWVGLNGTVIELREEKDEEWSLWMTPQGGAPVGMAANMTFKEAVAQVKRIVPGKVIDLELEVVDDG